VARWVPTLAEAKRLKGHRTSALLRAIIELAWARLELARATPHKILDDGLFLHMGPTTADPVFAARVGWAVRVVAQRIPWRSDCMVQARAAQRWLRRFGLTTELVIGVRKQGSALVAHAWLKHGDMIVTGGEITEYAALTTPEVRRALEVNKPPPPITAPPST
jgi:hypothetical protein